MLTVQEQQLVPRAPGLQEGKNPGSSGTDAVGAAERSSGGRSMHGSTVQSRVINGKEDFNKVIGYMLF